MNEPGLTPHSLQVRQENNAVVLTRLNRHVHGPHYERHPDRYAPYDYEKFVEWYEKVLAKEGAYSLVAYLDEEPVGYALLLHKKNKGEHYMLETQRPLFCSANITKP